MVPLRKAGRARGLTLIELVIVMGIVAVLAAVGMPSYNDLAARQRLANASSQVANELQQARYDAMQRNRTVYVGFRGGAQWCYAVSLEPGCDCADARTGPAPACALRRGDGQAFTGVSLPDTRELAFDPRLGGAGVPVAATFVLGERSAEVQLGASGRARACGRGTDLPGLPRCA